MSDLIPRAQRGVAAEVLAQVGLENAANPVLAAGGRTGRAVDPGEVDRTAAIEEHDCVPDHWRCCESDPASPPCQVSADLQCRHRVQGALHQLYPIQAEALLGEGIEVGHHGAGPRKMLAAGLKKLREDLRGKPPTRDRSAQDHER